MSTGIFTTYDLTEGTKLSIEDMIDWLDPYDVPLLGSYDPEGRRSIRKGTATQRKEEWLDDTLLNPRDTTAATATTGDTVITLSDRLSFTTDDIILIGDEYIRIDGYGTTANTVLVSRAYGGSTAATVADAADVVGVGTALPEGSDPNDGRYVDRSNRFNYTQIFGPYKVEVSETEQVIDKYGLSGTEMDLQVVKNVKQMGVAQEQAIMYGVRSIETSSKSRTMGGFTQYISTNNDSTTTDLTEAALRSTLQDCYDEGGNPTWMLTGSTQKGKVSQFATSLIQLDRTDKTRGQVVDYYECDFATVWIMKSRWVRLRDAFIFDGDQPEFLTLTGREAHFKRLGDTGDSQKGHLIAERSLRFHRESHAARFSALQA